MISGLFGAMSKHPAYPLLSLALQENTMIDNTVDKTTDNRIASAFSSRFAQRIYAFLISVVVCSLLCRTPVKTRASGLQTAPEDRLPGMLMHAAPNFTLADTNGHRHSLTDYRHRPVVLIFLTRDGQSAAFTHLWGQFQRSRAVEAGAIKAEKPLTVIVYGGDPASAHSLTQHSGLDMKQTVVLLDRQMGVTLGLYTAMPCPRVLVLDRAGIVSHIIGLTDNVPGSGSVVGIAFRTIQALGGSPMSTTKGPGPVLHLSITPAPTPTVRNAYQLKSEAIYE